MPSKRRSKTVAGICTVFLCYLSSSYARVLQVSTGISHACAILTEGTVKCWGGGNVGALGYGDTNTRGSDDDQMGNNLPYVDIGPGQTAQQIASGDYHNCAILNDSTTKCWGFALSGQLGYGNKLHRGDEPEEMGVNLSTVDLGTGRRAVQMSMGSSFSCAILDDATVKCWGFGFYGCLGYGNRDNRGDMPGQMGESLPTVDLGAGRTAKQITSGLLHTCVLLDDDSVKCWGLGIRLGYGDKINRGDFSNQMGDDLPTVDLGTGRTAVQIDAGGQHTCALLDDATVKCWGYGSVGQLGYGDTSILGDEPYEMGDNLTAVDVGENRTTVKIAAGRFHTCVILDDRSVKCWGQAAAGQLGYGNTRVLGDEPGEMGDDLFPVDLGTGRTAVQIANTGEFTCAVLDDATLKCWGQNNNGQLGYGDTIFRGDDSDEMGDDLLTVDLGSLTSAPSMSPSFTPTEAPTRSPSSAPTVAPSEAPSTLEPTLSPVIPASSLLDNPAVIGGIAAGSVVVLAAAGIFISKMSGVFGSAAASSSKAEVVLKV